MIRRTIGAVPVGSRYLIIAPPVFYRRFIEEPQLERTLEPLRIRSMDPRRNPVMGFRSLGWTVIGIGTALMAVAFWAPLLIEAAPALGAAAAPVAESTVAGTTAGAATVPPALGAAAVPVGEAAAGATGGGATILPFIRSAGGAAATVAQSEAARELARAAGVLIVLGIGSAARAEGDFHLERAEAVRAVPDSAVRVSDARRREVSYQGQRYFVIGLARASGPEGGSGEATETVDSR